MSGAWYASVYAVLEIVDAAAAEGSNAPTVMARVADIREWLSSGAAERGEPPPPRRPAPANADGSDWRIAAVDGLVHLAGGRR